MLIGTPEYAYGMPGVLKNALDWLVLSGELVNKPVATISASPSEFGGSKARACTDSDVDCFSREYC
ncbi:MAG: NAD(P)H-dependent oxidoreductase [Nostoc sp. DcaGUA01]|nr:NAD(P)H-dependent oxidoreductase [Nostoc sp. DcaGUA01]